MSYALNNVTTADTYTPATTLKATGSRRLNIDVANAGAYVQLGQGSLSPSWEDEVFITPSFRSMGRAFDWVRVRSAKAGQPAQVTIDAGPQ